MAKASSSCFISRVAPPFFLSFFLSFFGFECHLDIMLVAILFLFFAVISFFKFYDQGLTGYLSVAQYEVLFHELANKAYLVDGHDLPGFVEESFKQVDADGDGNVTIEEFLAHFDGKLHFDSGGIVVTHDIGAVHLVEGDEDDDGGDDGDYDRSTTAGQLN